MKIPVSVSMDENLIEELKAAAEKEGRNFSNLIEYIVRQYLENKSK